jgi:hypothetical protein
MTDTPDIANVLLNLTMAVLPTLPAAASLEENEKNAAVSERRLHWDRFFNKKTESLSKKAKRFQCFALILKHQKAKRHGHCKPGSAE